MEDTGELPAAWLALSPARQASIISYISDAMKLITGSPELADAAIKVVNRELSVLGVKVDLLSFEEFGRRLERGVLSEASVENLKD